MTTNDIQLIAVDIGYGDVKVKYQDKLFKFATCIERLPVSRTGFAAQQHNQHIYEYKGTKYVIDHNKNKAINTRSIRFMLNYSALLVYHAMKLVNIDFKKPIYLATGLSMVNWEQVEEFYDNLNDFIVDNEKISLNNNLTIVPQGRGIFDDYQGDKEGITYIVDIGYNTLDILCYENNNAVPEASFASKGGAHIIIEDMKNMLINDLGGNIDFSEQEAKEAFVNGFIKIAGEKVDLRDRIQILKENYCDNLLNELNARDEIVAKSDRIIFGGGGAYFIDQAYMKDCLTNALFSEEPFEFANVRGYYKKWLENNSKEEE